MHAALDPSQVRYWTTGSIGMYYLYIHTYIPFSGQVLTAAKEVCRQAFQLQPQRLVTPMYSCNIVVNAEMLGEFTLHVI